LDVFEVGKGLVRPQCQELFGLWIRQPAKQNGIDDAEDRGIRADAERERDHCRHREAGSLAQRAHREAKILDEIFETADAASVAAFFLSKFEAINVAECFAPGFLGA